MNIYFWGSLVITLNCLEPRKNYHSQDKLVQIYDTHGRLKEFKTKKSVRKNLLLFRNAEF